MGERIDRKTFFDLNIGDQIEHCLPRGLSPEPKIRNGEICEVQDLQIIDGETDELEWSLSRSKVKPKGVNDRVLLRIVVKNEAYPFDYFCKIDEDEGFKFDPDKPVWAPPKD